MENTDIDLRLKEIFQSGEKERKYTEDISAIFEVRLKVAEEDHKPFLQKDIDRITLPPYMPRGILKNQEWVWTDGNFKYYRVMGYRYIPRQTILSQGIELEEFIKAVEQRSGQKVTFLRKLRSLTINLDCLSWRRW